MGDGIFWCALGFFIGVYMGLIAPQDIRDMVPRFRR